MRKDDEVFEQLSTLSDIHMDPDKKQSLRDDLHRRMDRESRKRSLRQRLRSLAPVGVGAAAMVVAGAGITSIVMRKRSLPSPTGVFGPAIKQTTGAAPAGAYPPISGDLWFTITMAVLAVSMVVVVLTRRRAARWEWLRDALEVLRSPIFWGVTFGVVIGTRGIPVLVPHYSRYWVWEMPSGSYVASVGGRVCDCSVEQSAEGAGG